MPDPVQSLTIEGFRSIRKRDDFPLRPLNVLIGANGAGKSNFIGFFRLLREMVEQRLQVALAPTPNPPATMLFDEPELGLHPYFRCRRP